jgi:menaquinone-dependent protoporphyrinogen oxidase
MENKVLVAYASTNGSTQEIAEAVAAELGKNGVMVDLQPMRKAQSLQEYRAVVLGAPLYILHWHKDALKFLSQHRQALMERPVAIFASGPSFKGDEAECQEVRRQVKQELAKFPWLTPLEVEIMGGRFDPAKLRFPLNLIPALRQMPANDLRDWSAIRSWASSLAGKLQPVAPAPAASTLAASAQVASV